MYRGTLLYYIEPEKIRFLKVDYLKAKFVTYSAPQSKKSIFRFEYVRENEAIFEKNLSKSIRGGQIGRFSEDFGGKNLVTLSLSDDNIYAKNRICT